MVSHVRFAPPPPQTVTLVTAGGNAAAAGLVGRAGHQQQTIIMTAAQAAAAGAVVVPKPPMKKDHSYSCIVIGHPTGAQTAALSGGASFVTASGQPVFLATTNGRAMAAVAESAVAAAVEPDIYDCVAEETVIEGAGEDESSGGEQIVLEYTGEVPFHEGEVIEIKEEEIIHSTSTASSDVEMSVAMDLANLSQHHGHGQRQQVYVLQNGTLTPAGSFISGGGGGCKTAIPIPRHKYSSASSLHSAGRSYARSSAVQHDPDDPNAKPRLSYAQLIAEAIYASAEKRLTLAEIYAAIAHKYPYYRMETKGWQNAIRHNLSLNHSFVKVPRPANEGRGNYWTIDASVENGVQRRGFRYFRNKSSISSVLQPAGPGLDMAVAGGYQVIRSAGVVNSIAATADRDETAAAVASVVEVGSNTMVEVETVGEEVEAELEELEAESVEEEEIPEEFHFDAGSTVVVTSASGADGRTQWVDMKGGAASVVATVELPSAVTTAAE